MTHNITIASITLILVAPLILALTALYNIFLHPLRRYPGPALWATTRFFYFRSRVNGTLIPKCLELHRKYGDVVRIAPNELSYTTETAWKPIYGHRAVEMSRDFFAGNGPSPIPGVKNIIEVDKAKHARMRSAISRGFSDRALKEQESHMNYYVTLLLERLDEASGKGVVDMCKWFNWTTYDLIGYLSFGEAFGLLESGSNATYPEIASQTLQQQPKNQFYRYYGLDGIRKFITPTSTRDAGIQNFAVSKGKLNKRLSPENKYKTDRKDFYSYILQDQTKDTLGMTEGELFLMGAAFLAAGADTTATWLPATLYLLVKNEDKYARLVAEIRGAFATRENISITELSKLTYLSAVIEESLRLIPPGPGTFARIVPGEGEVINDQFVPGGTTVGVQNYAAYRLERNFHRAVEFIPERWLPEAKEGSSPFATDKRGVMHPFGVGARNCAGINLAYAEIRLILASVLWQFDVELDQASSKWEHDLVAIQVWERAPLYVHLKSAH